MTEIITIEAIDLPKISVANNRMITGIDIANNRMIDVGLYQLAVYSGAQCNAVVDVSLITGSSAWFYTFGTKKWTCMDLANDPALYDPAYYGWSITTAISTPV